MTTSQTTQTTGEGELMTMQEHLAAEAERLIQERDAAVVALARRHGDGDVMMGRFVRILSLSASIDYLTQTVRTLQNDKPTNEEA